MKITIRAIGETNEDFIKKGIELYLTKLKFYAPLVIETIRAHSGESEKSKEAEAGKLMNGILQNDMVILLDETGQQYTSIELSKKLQLFMNHSKNIYFLIGGAYGVSEKVKSRANFVLSLSRLTFTHQMVRLFLLEQIYRSLTILKGEKYHH